MTDPKTVEQKVDTTAIIAQQQQFPWDYYVMGNHYQNNRVYSMNTNQQEVRRGMGSYQNPTIKLFLPNILFLGAQKAGSSSVS